MSNVEISLSVVENLIREQFPQWSSLPIKPVEVMGWDNRTFHLGESMSIRLPSAERYAEKVGKEQYWLPKLAPHISCVIPQPLALGKPTNYYPWDWSIYSWIEGNSANLLQPEELDMNNVASKLAHFLQELHSIPIENGLLPGEHNFYRGTHPSVYDDGTREAAIKLQDFLDVQTILHAWEKAINSTWTNEPVWIHGDVSAGNIVIKDKELHGVIDFGGMAIGDPACDLVIAWTFFTDTARDIFISSMQLDCDTWNRARGWALWKSLITLASFDDKNSNKAHEQFQLINTLIHDI